MKDKIIIINGLGGCGKSTFIKLCKSYCENNFQNIKVHELSSIDFVKEVAKFCGWDGTKTTKNRIFLHEIKVVLEQWDDIPNKKVLEQIDSFDCVNNTNIFFVNIRENYNIENFKLIAKEKNLECITLEVINPNMTTNEVLDLIKQINGYEYDIVINNNKDLNHLSFLAKDFMLDLIDNKINKE